MDWALAIERNRSLLLRIVAEIAALVGALTAERLPRKVYFAALALLRPAEAAVRRLIVVAAHGLAVKPSPPRAAPAALPRGGRRERPPRFQLFDRRKRFEVNQRRRYKPGHGPRITFFPVDDDPRVPLFRPPVPDAITIDFNPARDANESVPCRPLCRRLAALQAALADIPREARRLARWRARRARMEQAKFRDPLRPGRPPGLRKRSPRPVDSILVECQRLARERTAPNTS